MPDEEDTLCLDTLIPLEGSDDSLSIVHEVRDTRGEEDTRALPHSTVIIAEDSEARFGQRRVISKKGLQPKIVSSRSCGPLPVIRTSVG